MGPINARARARPLSPWFRERFWPPEVNQARRAAEQLIIGNHARTRLSKNFQNREKRRSLRVHRSHLRAQKRLRTALCGASAPGLRRRDGFCRDGRFIKVSALIRW